MNLSKINEVRFWKRWYASGAVRQPQLIGDDLIIDAVGTFGSGPAKYQTLSLGCRAINPWVSTPVCWAVVTAKNYKPGMKLKRLPGNAVPVDVMFPKS